MTEKFAKNSREEDEIRFQFGIWHLILATAVAGGLFTFIAPFLRDLDLNRWLLVGSVGGGFLMGLGLLVVTTIYPRYEARRHGGALLVDLPNSIASAEVNVFLRVLLILAAVVLAIGLIFTLIACPTYASSPLPQEAFFFVAGLCSALTAGAGQIYVFVPKSQLREYGVVIDAKFIPWRNLRTAYWSRLHRGWMLRIGDAFVHELKIDPQQRDTVEEILRERFPEFGVGPIG